MVKEAVINVFIFSPVLQEEGKTVHGSLLSDCVSTGDRNCPLLP